MKIEDLTSETLAFGNQTITVSTTAELNTALASLSAGSGGTILLDPAGGPYEIAAMNMSGAPVLVAGADEADMPDVIGIDVYGSSNLTFANLDISSAGTDREAWKEDLDINFSDNITLADCTMSGSATGYLPEKTSEAANDRAISIQDSSNVTITGTLIENYYLGVGFGNVQGLTFTHNEITGMQGDGMHGNGLQDATIAYNNFHDFYGTTQEINHADMLQIWDNNSEILSKNIEIHNNVFDSGGGSSSQSIFIVNDSFKLTGVKEYFENISVYENLIFNSQANGIVLDHVDGATVYNNTVLFNEADAEGSSPRIQLADVLNGSATGNIGEIVWVNGELQDQTNFLVDYTDAQSPNYVYTNFVNLTAGGDLDLRDLLLRPDSEAYGKFGAAISSDYASDQPVTAVLMSSQIEGTQMGIYLSAELSMDGGAFADDATTEFVWTFDDGKQVTGQKIVHFFEDPGSYEVTLEVRDADGNSDTLTREFRIEDPELFDLTFGQSITDLSSWASDVDVTDTQNDAFGNVDGKSAFHLTADSHFQITRDNDQIFNLDTFKLDLGFKMDSMAETGRIAALPKTLELQMEAGGAVSVQLTTTDGTFNVQSGEGVVTDTRFHDISVNYDSVAGKLELVVDDTVAGSTEATGATPPELYWGLNFGDSKGNGADGWISHASMSTPTSSALEHIVSEELATDEGMIGLVPETMVVTFDTDDTGGQVTLDTTSDGTGSGTVEDRTVEETSEPPVVDEEPASDEPEEEESDTSSYKDFDGFGSIFEKFFELLSRIFGGGSKSVPKSLIKKAGLEDLLDEEGDISLEDLVPATEPTEEDAAEDETDADGLMDLAA